VGEFDLIAKLQARLGKPGPGVLLGSGDDAAVTKPRGVAATSVDAIVDGVHFRRSSVPLEAIGRKALAAALSDLAAMGAQPGEAYIALGVPQDLGEEGCLELLAGAEAVAAETATTLAGGDVTRSAILFAAVTVVGYAESEADLVTRSGARDGDVVAVTGRLGGAAAGLRMIERETAGETDDLPGLPEGVAGALRARQLEPRPRLLEGRALARAGASAMIDVSDGLGSDARHVAEQSGVRLEIDLAALPIQDGVMELARVAGEDSFELATAVGEDYELLVCLPAEALERARSAVRETDCELTAIGRCVAGDGVRLSDQTGRELQARGHDQLT
jgi:thiamine-monophosphate kinase